MDDEDIAFPRSESEVIAPSKMLDMLPVPRSSSEVVKPSEVFLELMMLDPLRQEVSRQATGVSTITGSFAAAPNQGQALCRTAAPVSNIMMAPIQATGSYGPSYSSLTAPHAGAGSFILRRGGESPVSPLSPKFPAQFAVTSPSHMPTHSPLICTSSSHMPTPPQLSLPYHPSPAFAATNQLLPQALPQVQTQPQPQVQAQCTAGARVAAPARAFPEASQVLAQARPTSMAVPATLQMQQQAISPVPRPLQQAAASFTMPAAARAQPAHPQPTSVAVPATLQLKQQAASLIPTPSPFASYGATPTPASLQLPAGSRFRDVLGVSQTPAPRTMPTYSPMVVSNHAVTAGTQSHGQAFSMPMPRQGTLGPQPITMGTSAAALTIPGMTTMQWPRQSPPRAIAATAWWGSGQSIPSSVTAPSQPFQARPALPPGVTPMQSNRDFAMQAAYPSPISSPLSFQPRSPQMDVGFAMQAAQLAASKFPLPRGF